MGTLSVLEILTINQNQYSKDLYVFEACKLPQIHFHLLISANELGRTRTHNCNDVGRVPASKKHSHKFHTEHFRRDCSWPLEEHDCHSEEHDIQSCLVPKSLDTLLAAWAQMPASCTTRPLPHRSFCTWYFPWSLKSWEELFCKGMFCNELVSFVAVDCIHCRATDQIP